MDLLKPRAIEDLILLIIQKGEQNTGDILRNIQNIRKNTTKQAFYSALRKLKSDEVVVVYKGSVALHTTWIRNMQEKIDQMAQAYSVGLDAFSVLSLANQESISFIFYNSRALDSFWGHSQNILMYNTTPGEPIYSYDPHYWFFIARQDSERKLLKEIVRNKRQFLMAVGGADYLDKVIKREFNNDHLQYSFKKVFEKDNYYLTVIGDYITEVWLDPAIARKVETIYKQANRADEETEVALKKLLEIRSRNKIRITRNRAKAERIKNKLKKDFYIVKN